MPAPGPQAHAVQRCGFFQGRVSFRRTVLGCRTAYAHIAKTRADASNFATDSFEQDSV